MKKGIALILFAAGVAAAMRLPKLDNRPMHTDEAVHAYKFGELLQENAYKYNPNEYHGPTLNYFTLIPAWLAGVRQYAQLNEWILRIVPVFFGVLMVIGVLLVMDGLGPKGAFWAAIFTALSTAMVFYSRYYIQEILLVCFTFGLMAFGWRYSVRPRVGWAIAAGVSAGLMFASKETCVIAFASMAVALIATLLVSGAQRKKLSKDIRPRHIALGAGAGVITAILFYSSFFANPGGIIDALRTYSNYAHKAGDNILHIHPWYYYLQTIGFTKYEGAPLWSEWIIILLALVGIWSAFRKGRPREANAGFVRFLAVYAVLMAMVYSAIPYKTPWSILSGLHAFILLAGVGAVELVGMFRSAPAKVAAILLVLVGTCHLGRQAFEASYRHYTDTTNPYVYAQSLQDVVEIADKVKDIAAAHPDGNKMYVEVICPEDDYWPLPWYLRQLSRVAYASRVLLDSDPGEVIIAMPVVEDDLRKKWYEETQGDKPELYVRLFPETMYLRPRVELRGYVKSSVYERWLRARSTAAGEQGQ